MLITNNKLEITQILDEATSKLKKLIGPFAENKIGFLFAILEDEGDFYDSSMRHNLKTPEDQQEICGFCAFLNTLMSIQHSDASEEGEVSEKTILSDTIQ